MSTLAVGQLVVVEYADDGTRVPGRPRMRIEAMLPSVSRWAPPGAVWLRLVDVDQTDLEWREWGYPAVMPDGALPVAPHVLELHPDHRLTRLRVVSQAPAAEVVGEQLALF